MKWLLVAAFCALGIGQASAGIAAEDYARESMRGLKGVNVSVSVDGPDQWFSDHVSTELLLTKVELRLRTAGIRVLSAGEWGADPRMPTFVVTILACEGSRTNDGQHVLSYAIHTEVALEQRLLIPGSKAPSRSTLGSTWHRPKVLHMGGGPISDGKLTARIEDQTDQFINAWLATHPK